MPAHLSDSLPRRGVHPVSRHTGGRDHDRHSGTRRGVKGIWRAGADQVQLQSAGLHGALAHRVADQQPDRGEQAVTLVAGEQTGQTLRVVQGDGGAEQRRFGDRMVEPGLPAALDEVQPQLGGDRGGGG